MSFFNETVIETIKLGKTIEYPKCPMCQNDLIPIINGEPDPDFEKFLEKNKIKYTLGGCCCYMDDRDAEFYCHHCHMEYNKNIKSINLIPCFIEVAIFPEECKQYDVMEKHYTEIYEGYTAEELRNKLYDDKQFICNVLCPARHKLVRVITTDGEKFEGNLDDVFHSYRDDDATYIELVWQTDPYRRDYKRIPLSDVNSVKVLGEGTMDHYK